MTTFGKRLVSAACCAMLLAAWNGSAAQGGSEAAIKYRQSIMKGVGGHTGAIAQIVKGETPYKSHLARHARALHDLMTMVPDAFKEETTEGDTRAKAKIWTDPEGFRQAADRAISATKAFADAAASGNSAVTNEKVKAVFDGCKGCHKDYREKRE